MLNTNNINNDVKALDVVRESTAYQDFDAAVDTINSPRREHGEEFLDAIGPLLHLVLIYGLRNEAACRRYARAAFKVGKKFGAPAELLAALEWLADWTFEYREQVRLNGGGECERIK